MLRVMTWWLVVLCAHGCSRAPAAPPRPIPVAESAGTGDELPPIQPDPVPGDPMGVTVHRLSNGLTVYVSTDRQAPRFQAWIAVRAGSRHDPADSTGLAHYLEHMLFKGTDELGTTDMGAEQPHLDRIAGLYEELRETSDGAQRARILGEIDRATVASAAVAIPNELDRLYAGLGIESVNAFTTPDATVYIADVPSNRLAAWAAVEGERFTDPVFRLFWPELEAVYEEKNLSLDRPEDRVEEEMMLGLFPRHPYGTQPTLGHVEHLKVPAYRDMEAFYRRWYRPNNMAIILAGDVDAETALPLLERAFARREAAPLDHDLPGEVASLDGRVFREVRASGEESVTIAWPTPGLGHADEPALLVMGWLMDNEATGLIQVELELPQRVLDAGSHLTLQHEAGYFVMRATAREGQSLDEVEQLLMQVVGKMHKGAFTPADVRAVVLHEQIAEQRRLETPGGRVARMLEAYLSRKSWPEVLALEERLDAVRRKDVVDVARAVLGEGRVVVHRRRGEVEPPRIDKPAITPVPIDPSRRSAYARGILDMPAPAVEPRWLEEGRDYARGDLPTGPLVTVENRLSRLYRVVHRFQHGYRDEPLLCHAIDLLELSGTADRAPEQLQRELHALGTTVSFGCNADESTVVVSGIDGTMDESLALVSGWLADVKLEPAAVAEHLAGTLRRRRDHLDNTRLLARVLADFANFGPDTAWLDHPSNADLARASAADLRAVLAAWPARVHTTLYFGPRQAEAVGGRLVLTAGEVAPAREPRPRRYRKVRKPRVFFLHRDVAKSNIEVLFPRPPLPREDRPVADLYSEMLGGNMSSLVVQEIREARGLAYSAGAYYTSGRTLRDDSALIGRMATQGDKTAEAIRTYLGLVVERAPGGDRVEAARVALDERYRSERIEPRRIPDKIWAWDLLGQATDPRPFRWQRVRETTLEELVKFARDSTGGPVIVSVLGSRDRVDLPALRRIGRVEEKRPAELFSYGAFPAAGSDAAAP